MNNRKNSLRRQFLLRLFMILIVTALLSGIVQLGFIREEVSDLAEDQATLIAQSMNKGLEQSDVASTAIEHQIDLKLVALSRHIASLLKGLTTDQITEAMLIEIRDQLGIAGITLLAPQEGDIAAIRATEPSDMGFSLKQFGFLEAGQTMLNGGRAEIPGATYIDDNITVLPIAQSAMHTEETVFYKYAYYHPEGEPYIISPYIQADEVNQFVAEVGIDTWISKVGRENEFIVEIAVLSPQAIADPSLETQMYPPIKKIKHGSFDYESEEDLNILKNMLERSEPVTSIQEIDDKKLYKMFFPLGSEEVVYLSLDYDMLSDPVTQHSIVLILSGFVSLIALFMLTARFFNGMYVNLQQIGRQIVRLEARDFTAQSQISGKGELSDLSDSTNRMVKALNKVLQDTMDQAGKMQRLSMMLEADTNQSVEKVLLLSMETTTESREEVEKFYEFLDLIEKQLDRLEQDEMVDDARRRIETLRELSRDSAHNTTEITITLSDILKSLHEQSSELSEISNLLLKHITKFKLQ